MTLEELFAIGGPLAATARKFVEASADFLGELSKNNITLDLGPSNETTNEVDYEAPSSEAYKRTYKPITASEIIQANKSMTENISGEKWVAGFLACVQLILIAKP